LAQSLYYCHAELYGQLDRLPHWQGLTWREQHVWVQRATDVMTFLEPAAVTRSPVGQPAPLAATADGVARPVTTDYFALAKVLAFRGQDDSQGMD